MVLPVQLQPFSKGKFVIYTMRLKGVHLVCKTDYALGSYSMISHQAVMDRSITCSLHVSLVTPLVRFDTYTEESLHRCAALRDALGAFVTEIKCVCTDRYTDLLLHFITL